MKTGTHKSSFNLEDNIVDIISFTKLNEIVVLTNSTKDGLPVSKITVLKQQKMKFKFLDTFTFYEKYDKLYLNMDG